jgi:hypothetical protein
MLSDVEGVEMPGDAFMKEVSKMNVGDIGVALNRPQTIAYVIRVTRVEPDLTVLHDRFLQMGLGAYQAAARPEITRQQAAWGEHLLKEVDFEFLEPLANETEGSDEGF